LLRLLSFLLFLSFQANCQWNAIAKYNVNAKWNYGFIMRHNSDVAHLANQRPYLFEIDVYKQTEGSRPWHQIHHFPNIGYSLNYVVMDPVKPLGNMVSLVIYMAKTICRFKTSRLELRIGLGPGYAEKRFDLHYNYKNNMISSRFSFCLSGRINYVLPIGNNFNVNMGVGIIHFSNGSIKLPNQGINIPGIHLGIGFQKAPVFPVRSDTLPFFRKETCVNIMYAVGFKEEYPIQGPKILNTSLSVYLNRKVNRKSGIVLGMDLFYDPSIQRFLNDYRISLVKKHKAGITAGHELFFGRLSLLTQLGIYIYDPYHLKSAVYQRYGLKYYCHKSFFLQLTMKSHFGSVDFVEWGTGLNL
jgi:hypothetical protein